MEITARQRESLILPGRVLLALIFVTSGLNKIPTWDSTLSYMGAQGMPFAAVFLAAAIVIEVGAGLGVLLGWKTRWSALALALYLVPVTLIFHAFWSLSGMDRQVQLINFMKNLAILGGLLGTVAFGPGRLSLDARGWRAGGGAEPGGTKERDRIKLVS